MKRSKFFVLCAVLAMLLASCGENAASSAPASDGSTSAAESSSSASQASETGAAEYPDSLRIWAPSFSDKMSSLGVSDYNACAAWQTISQNTGTEITWEYGSSANDPMINFNLMLSSGEYPDMIAMGWDTVPGGIAQYAEDGVLVDLTDMYPTNLSNVYDALNNIDALNYIKASDGRLYYVPEVNDRPGSGVYQGLVIRQDMLDDLGEEAPATIDEFHALLTKAKETYGDSFYPLTGSGFNNTIGIGPLLWPFGITYDFYLEGDTVCYGPLSDRFTDAMGYIHTLYAEGLIDPDYATQDRNAEKGKIMSDQSMVVFEFQPSAMMEAMKDQNPEFQLVGIPDLKETEDSPAYTFNREYLSNLTVGSCVAITTGCEEPEKAANFLNYIFSEEGRMITNWGEEGVDFVYGEDGKPQWTDEYRALAGEAKEYLHVFGALSAFPSLRSRDAYLTTLPEVSVQAIELWTEANDTSRILPPVTLTTEEQDEISDWQANLNTYMDERYSGLVNGQISIDSIPQIQQELRDSMHIEEILAAYQAAYNRFNG